ncbi:ABC transporter substrate-binding protein [Paenibacillus sp. IB182496]|uniref:ABC transporter substrate-binding protein n=1 Tax=Paenibacillus sabuli TaxID=2772509 RepID=A0A927BQ64_9BACL|nr:ABC transporter substrate-binding protein [Paenibacillus sabuli]MBD2843725.1 ABC transporter substrate-binding protein [Paenibacillus sabuli]
MKRNKMLLATVLVLMVALLAACGGNNGGANSGGNNGGTNNEAGADTGGNAEGSDAPEEATIRLGYVGGGMTPVAVQIGMNTGAYEEANINIEATTFSSGADMVQALVGGSLDVVLGSYEHVLRQQKNGLGVKAFGEIYNGVGYALVVKSDSPYQTLADVKGETLAVTKVGSLSHTGLSEGLNEAGLDPDKDVTIINAGSGATMFAAIDGDQVAGGMVSEPTLSQMVETGDFRVLYDPEFPFAGIVVMADSDWVADHEEGMSRFLAVTDEAASAAKADPASAVDAMLKEFDQITPEVMEAAVTNNLRKVPEGLVLSEEGADKVHQSQLDEGVLTEPIPFDQAVDLSLLP